MKKINKEEMKSVNGGFDLTANFLTSLIRGVNTFLDLGRTLGSSIRRASAGKACPL